MRLYNLPNSAAMTDRERTFFGLSFYSCGIFDYKLSNNTDPSDPGDTGVSSTNNSRTGGFAVMRILKQTLNVLGKKYV